MGLHAHDPRPISPAVAAARARMRWVIYNERLAYGIPNSHGLASAKCASPGFEVWLSVPAPGPWREGQDVTVQILSGGKRVGQVSGPITEELDGEWGLRA